MKQSSTRRPILLVGSPDDAHIQALSQRLAKDDVPALVVDTLGFPDETRMSLTDDLEGIEIDGRRIDRPGAVYVRGLYAHPLAFGVDAREAMEADWTATLTVFREKATFLLGLMARWEAMGVPMYNPPSAEWRGHKPGQIAILKSAGLPVPETLWSNDPEAVRRFASRGRVAYKPIMGGAATRELSLEDLGDERLAALASSPVTFQELLPGDDIRVYVLDGEVIASLKIITEAIDFRQNEEAVEVFTLPAGIEGQCLRAAEVLGLRWTGMDLKGDVSGTLKILELNSSAMFLGFDSRAGTDILGALAAGLARAASEAR